MKNKKIYKKAPRIMLLSCLFFAVSYTANAANSWVATQGGNWEDVNTWGGTGYPVAGDDATIGGGFIVTVNGTADECATVEIGDGSNNGILHFSGTSSLIVDGTLTVGTSGDVGALVMGSGTTLTVGNWVNGGPSTNAAYNMNNGLVVLKGAFALPVGASPFNNVETSAGATPILTSESTTINGNLTIDDNTNFECDGTDPLTIGGSVFAGTSSATAGLFSYLVSTGTSGSNITIGGSISGTGSLNLYGAASGVLEGELCSIGGDMTIAGFSKDLSSSANPSTVLFNGSGHSQLIECNNNPTQAYAFDYVEIENTSGVNLGNNSGGGHFEVDWDLDGNAPLNTSTTQVWLFGDMNLTNNNYVTSTGQLLKLLGASNAINFVGNNSLSGTNTILHAQTFYNVESDNFNTLLFADVVIIGDLDFANGAAVTAVGDGGGFLLQGHNLDMTSGYVTWEGAAAQIPTDGYIITDQSSAGYLYMTTSTTSGRTFPVGDIGWYDGSGANDGVITNSYTPITFTSANTADVLHVLVKAGLTNSNLHAMADSAINHEWVVQAQNGTADDFTTTTSWFSTADELPGMDYTAAYLSSRTQESTSPAYWIPFGRTTQGGAPFTGATYEGGTAPDSFLSSKPLSMSSAHTFYIATGSDNILANALPVTLVNFTAAPENGVVDLNWNTASEINNNYFEVERSVNGQNWTAIGQVKGNGTTMLMHNYAFVDNLAGVVPAGKFYYRLKQVDFNGVFAYSMVRSVDLSSVAPNLVAYPNPAGNTLNVNWTSTSNDITTLKIVNIAGVTVYQTTAVGQGQMQKQMDLSGLATGTYFLQISSDSGMTMNQTISKN